MAVTSKISSVTKNIGGKMSAAIETQKLNSKINAEKTAIDGVYKKLGEFYYQRYKSGEKMPDEASAFCAQIDGHNKAIDETKAEIERVNAKVEADAAVAAAASAPAASAAAASAGAAAAGIACPSCGTANAPGTKFCRECGAKLPDKPAPVAGACPSCGSANAPGTKFCRECGAKLPESAAGAGAVAPAPGTCPSCGHVNAPGTKFCRECGAKLN
jgi:uncharacterized OB-fold protein